MSACSRGQDYDSQVLYETRELKAIAARWDAKAASWDRALEDPACHLNEDEAYARFLDEVRLVIKDRAGFCAKQGVIDVGCGTGLVLAAVGSSFAWGIGVDISQKMIRVAQAKHLTHCQFLVGDCFQLPSICPRAGAVVSRGVLLSHYGSRHGEALLRSAREALIPNGFAVFDFLNEGARRASNHAPENKTYFTPASVRELAGRVGFERSKVLGSRKRRVLLLFAEVG